jgi:predicted RecB family nuclease
LLVSRRDQHLHQAFDAAREGHRPDASRPAGGLDHFVVELRDLVGLEVRMFVLASGTCAGTSAIAPLTFDPDHTREASRMQRTEDELLYSASDLLNFLGCRHATFLDLVDLETPLPKAVDDPQLRLRQEKGLEHERAHLQRLREQGKHITEISAQADLQQRIDLTHAAMKSGADVIYQAVLFRLPWYGYADFLCRVEQPSNFGAHRYEVVDTKLARSPSARYALQLCMYTDLLASAQGVMPTFMHLVLGDGRQLEFRTAEFNHYYAGARQRFEQFCAKPPKLSFPQPCRHCSLCRWRDRCDAQWTTDDHLYLVADISRSQIQRLNDADITTVRALSQTAANIRIPKLSDTTFARLRQQASLQILKRDTGKDVVELLPIEPERGFARMPAPDPADILFDMEGDPLYPDGLEYLFGLYWIDADHPRFAPFWGHDHYEERRAFEATMDTMRKHLRAHPRAHIYHYAQYEVSAIKRLASRYGSREAFVDDLLRRQKLIDLYRVVREAIRVSEPSYSIKNLETFYMEKRSGEVKSGGESIVVYEDWRKTGDTTNLQEIAAYNEADCRSTLLLRNWLAELRPKALPWRPELKASSDATKEDLRTAAEQRHDDYVQRLTAPSPKPRSNNDRQVRQLTADMLDFHRRAAKPEWWAMFDRQGQPPDELIDDPECIGGLQRDVTSPPQSVGRSTLYTYRFPPQDYKFSLGDSCRRSDTLQRAGTIELLDPDQGLIQLKCGPKVAPLPDQLSIIPTGPLDAGELREALYRFADAVLQGSAQYRAVRDLLNRAAPRLQKRKPGAPVIADGAEVLSATIAAVAAMSQTCLFIQGPPGSGKTFTASHVILELIKSGRRIGVASNSHKAINNLLRAIELRANEQGVAFRGLKKSTTLNLDSFFHGTMIHNVTSNKEVDLSADLLAGTAWLFANGALNQQLDYLFVDEAGQVSLANIVAMGLAARNLVLVGDQMQLGQPIQGVHPGESGLSVLEYRLQKHATIPPD